MRLLRAFLIVEFLIAIDAIFTFWSQVGGQYHLDLMFWPWKFGICVAAALCVTGMTAGLARSGGAMTRRVWVLGSLLIVTIAIAGCVTYYYHLNEPPDEDETDDTAPTVTSNLSPGARAKLFPAGPCLSDCQGGLNRAHAASLPVCRVGHGANLEF